MSVNIRLFTTSFLLNALAEDNCCHVENRGGPTLPVLVNVFPVLLILSLTTGCSQIVVLEKTLERPLDNEGIKPVNPKGTQP